MGKRLAVLFVDVVILLVVVLGSMLPSAPAPALAHPAPVQAPARADAGASLPRAPATAPSRAIDTAGPELTVMDDETLRVPFKLDRQIMFGPHDNNTRRRIRQPVSWQPTQAVSVYPGMPIQGDITAVAAGGERILAASRDVLNSNLHSYLWWPGSDASWDTHDLGLAPHGDPFLISLTPERGFLLVQDQDDFAQYRWWNVLSEHPWEGDWHQVPGQHYTVGSDLAAVSRDPNHITLFFRDAVSNTVQLTEWQAGVDWRSKPVDLGNPPGTVIVSELAAVSRNDRHVAVFGVGQDNALYYREWTSANKSDWSDTAWTWLVDGVVGNSSLSVASRHHNQMAVAYARTNGTVAYMEWLAGGGWDGPGLGDPGFSSGVPPVIAVASIDTMVLFGVGQDSRLKRIECGPKASCGSWELVDTDVSWEPNQRLVTVVRRTHDLTVIGRDTGGSGLLYKQYSNEGALVQGQGHDTFWGKRDGQVVATVQGRSVWLTTLPTVGYGCQVAASEAGNWPVTGSALLDGQSCTAEPRGMAVAAGDLDGDGNDEVVVTTPYWGRSIDTSVVQITVVSPTDAPILGLDPEPSQRVTLGDVRDIHHVDVAIGDLDGDGRDNEVVVAYNTSEDVTTPGTIGMYVYRYADGGLQLQGEPQTFSPWTKGNQPPASVWDFEIASGRLAAYADRHEQLVLAVELAVDRGKRYDMSWDAYLYEWVEGARGDRSLLEREKAYEFTFANFPKDFGGYWGQHSISLSTGDVDGDGLEDIVYAHPYRLYTSTGEECRDCLPELHPAPYSGVRSLAVGDVDDDSRAEILRFTDVSGGSLDLVEWADVPHEVMGMEEVFTNTHLYATSQVAASKGVPLLADLAGNSLQAELVGCDDYDDVNVTAVVNGVPRFYEDGEPMQVNTGSYATGNGDTKGGERGTKGIFGGSVAFARSFGNEHVVKATFKVEDEFLGMSGTSTMTETTTATQKGETMYEAESRGLVVYSSSAYRCCQYDAYYPSAPDDKSTMLTCTPAQALPQTSALLEDWHLEAFKAEAGPSWVDVGRASAPEAHRRTNGVSTYPAYLPVDPYLVKWHDTSPTGPLTLVKGSSDPEANPHSWGLEQSSRNEKVKEGSFETKTTISAAFERGNWEFELAAIGGIEEEWTSSVGWEESLSFEGEVYDYPNSCPEEICIGRYTVLPFVCQATATTEAGVTYPYLELDYYVPDPPGTLAGDEDGQAAGEAILGIQPQQPVIASHTHPDPETWYADRDVTFTWEQPVGDPAVVTGYRWNLNDTVIFTPTALHRIMTDTLTFEAVADGLHYFHLQARGDGGDDSPIAHRAVRIDATAPKVGIIFDPLVPDGFNDWYKSPVEASLTVTDGLGSGVASVEYRIDSGEWQPYAVPVAFDTPTAGTTLWARASDSAGHTSEPVSSTFKLDLVAPTSMDPGGAGITYSDVFTDELGNNHMVLGGVSHDDLAGRFMVEVKATDTGAWRSVHTVGEFPMPLDNGLVTAEDTLNWVYTPTREIRGIYPLWGRSLDAAGVQEEEWVFGDFWWEPDGVPDLSQTHASVTPRKAFPGDTVRFTLGIRNIGVQESQVAITDNLPAELAPLPESIGYGGEYDAAAGAIHWTLHDLWPGETRYLTFDAQVSPELAPTEPITLVNAVDLLGYWPWEPPEGGPSEPPGHAYTTSNTLTILPQGMAHLAEAQAASKPPAIYTAKVLEGAIVEVPLATLYVHTSSDTEYLYVKEWVWDQGMQDWALASDSGWLPFVEGDSLAVSEDSTGKHGRLAWQLSTGDGVKFLGVWAANGYKHTTNLNEGNLLFTNFVSPSGQHLAAGQRIQYRLPMQTGQLAIFALATESGDADLYAWKPRFAFRPHYYSNEVGDGYHVEGFGFGAQECGVYIVEVEAAGVDSFYHLLVGGDISGAASPGDVRAALGLADDADIRGALPRGRHLPLEAKERPQHPLTLGTPYGLPDADELGEVPQPPLHVRFYLPIISKNGLPVQP